MNMLTSTNPKAVVLALLLNLLNVWALAGTESDRKIDFRRDIRPILSDRCFQCHGPDESKRQANLRLDLPESAQSVINSQQPQQSKLLQRITSHDPAELMPPPEVNKALSPVEQDLLKQWIVQGASWQQHWAYEKPRRWLVPPTALSIDHSDGQVWERNWIDRFVLEKLQQHHLTFNPDADSVSLLRRLCFDLTGLPPTPELVQRWQRAELNYEQLVELLLFSPQYGERMATYWLDLVRYADTVGYHGDQDQNISAYRDWVIHALNAGMPFDQMTVEQLAGDLLPNPTQQQKIATGYNRLLQTTHEGGLQPSEYRAIYAADRVRNVSEVWLAASVGCAQCHDHKFDPYSSLDFYKLAAFFADIDDEDHFKTGNNELPTRRAPELELPTPEQLVQLDQLNVRVAQLKTSLADLKQADSSAAEKALTNGETDPINCASADRTETSRAVKVAEEQLKSVQFALATLNKSIRRSMITVALPQPRITRILPRGNWLDESGEIVQSGLPAFLLTASADVSQPTTGENSRHSATPRLSRLELARWLVDSQNGVGLMTARVMVNRLWYLLFGHGLARQLDEFGNQGEPPTHPELLDNLALHLVEHHWDLRSTIRLIVLSRSYQQSSISTAAKTECDPLNRWLSRQNAFRLPAEAIRDNALAVSGLLVQTIGGESSRPYQPKGYYKLLNFPEREYTSDQDQRQWRRGLYVHWQRQFLHPMLRAFDAPSREQCTAQRPQSNTALAALAMLNDPTFVEAARVMAERLLTLDELPANLEVDSTDLDHLRIEHVYRWATSREITAPQQQIFEQLLQINRQHFQSNPVAADQLLTIGIRPLEARIAKVELASWTEVCRAVLNLADTCLRY